ncbi:MAG: DUF2283 domain-containing protein [Methylococcaceae bacterium]|nr:DUF2283 domain-containing protein [Methylococcaceae bacterium]
MNNKIILTVSEDDDDVAYLELPGHPGRGVSGAIGRQIRLLDLTNYVGPDIYLDFDSKGHLVGLEILG